MLAETEPMNQNCARCGSDRLGVAERDCSYLPEGWLELVDVCIDCHWVMPQGLPPWREGHSGEPKPPELETSEVVAQAVALMRERYA
jgi:hypothetical protein